MFSRELLIDLYRHMEWADATVWSRTPSGAAAPDDRLRLLLVHIHTVQRAFLHVWTGRPLEGVLRNPEDFGTLDEVRTWGRTYYREAAAFIGAATADQLARPVTLPWAAELTEYFGRPPDQTTLGETCFQVASHSTYHRGQVNSRLRDLGCEPPLVDYIAWLWFGRPEPAWPA